MWIGTTFGRYLSMRFFKTILVIFLGVFLLIYSIDYLEMARRVGDVEGVSAGLVARLSLFRTPSVAEQVLPFAVLFGSMMALLQLSRKLELVVARAAGISAWQFLLPGICVAGALGIFSVTAFNPLSAFLKQQALTIEARIAAKTGKTLPDANLWLRQGSPEGQAVIQARGSIANAPILTGVTVFLFDKEGAFLERIEASEATLKQGYWELTQARVSSPTEEPESFAVYHLPSSLEPSQVRQSFTSPDSVPFWDLRDVIDRTERSGLDATRYKLQFSVLLMRPFLFIAMVLVAASVSLRFFRFGGVAKMVLGGVIAGFVLYVATELMQELGASGLLNPAVAAGLPVAVGSLLGTLALLYQEDG